MEGEETPSRMPDVIATNQMWAFFREHPLRKAQAAAQPE
jgi:hypothetical protein